MERRVKVLFGTICGASLLLGASAAIAGGWPPPDEPPIELKIRDPKGGNFPLGAKVKSGEKELGPGKRARIPTLFEDGWTMTFRMTARESEAVVRVRESFGFGGVNYDVLVTDDPDDCLDLSGVYPEEQLMMVGTNPGPLETCDDGADETAVLFVVDEFDAPLIKDENDICTDAFQRNLIDDAFGAVPFTESNKPYVELTPGNATENIGTVGPFTGGPETSVFNSDIFDCFGFGFDDDIPSLVVMANVGPSRIFDENLNYDNTRIRNLAGFVSGVSFELLDRNDESAILARLPVRPGLLRPIAFFDTTEDIEPFGTFSAPFTMSRKIEDGPTELIFSTTAAGVSKVDAGEALLEALPNEYLVEIRAVLVDGVAPSFIDDANNDGEFTAEDLVASGYTLLSNEAVQSVELINYDTVATEEDPFECPGAAVYVDLDGSITPDDIPFGCEDGDGTSRSGVRVPR